MLPRVLRGRGVCVEVKRQSVHAAPRISFPFLAAVVQRSLSSSASPPRRKKPAVPLHASPPDEVDLAERPKRALDMKVDRAAPPKTPAKNMLDPKEFFDKRAGSRGNSELDAKVSELLGHDEELPLWLRYTAEDLERANVSVDMFGRPVIAADRPESWQFAPRGADATRQRFGLRRESGEPVAPPLLFRSKFALQYVLPTIAFMSGWRTKRAQYQMMTRRLVNKMRAHADRDAVLDLFYLPDTFQSWFSVNIVHLWMVLVRLRKIEERSMRNVPQMVFDHFWRDTETECLEQGRISSPFVLSKHMRYIEKQYYGCVISYDEGLVVDDAKLAEAFWRNIYHMQAVDARRLNEIVAYVRRELAHLDSIPDDVLFDPRERIFQDPEPTVSLDAADVLDGGISLSQHIAAATGDDSSV
jgi:hypothetical protein